MTPAVPVALPVLLGLGAAGLWGGADFAGGLATRRAPAGLVVLVAHVVSLLLLVALAASLHAPVLTHAQTWKALLSGVVGGLGLMLFYQALASGLMGLTAALAGLITTILPVTLAIVSTGWPGGLKLAGFAVAGAAILMIAAAPAETQLGAKQFARRELLFGALAGIGFGLQLVLLHSSVDGNTGAPALLRALTFSRVGGTAVALLAVIGARSGSRQHAGSAGFLLLAATAGILDTLGNLFYMKASLAGRLDVAAVLSSLYPAGTILLAAWILKERTTRIQAFGIGLALAAVALISK
jgi:drug/metabolite transporter (DMT)-like permease